MIHFILGSILSGNESSDTSHNSSLQNVYFLNFTIGFAVKQYNHTLPVTKRNCANLLRSPASSQFSGLATLDFLHLRCVTYSFNCLLQEVDFLDKQTRYYPSQKENQQRIFHAYSTTYVISFKF